MKDIKIKDRKSVLAKTRIKYTQSELRETIECMLAYTATELHAVYTSDTASIYERVLAAALLQALRERKLPTIETLLSRVCGRPKETIDITPQIIKHSKFQPIDAADAAKAYAEMVRR